MEMAVVVAKAAPTMTVIVAKACARMHLRPWL